MSYPRTGYLSGFSQLDYYAAPGLYGGSLPAGFAVSLLFRAGQAAGDPAGGVRRWLCGNLQPTGANTARGWALFANETFPGVWAVELIYGDGAEALVFVVRSIEDEHVIIDRSILVQLFFGIRSSASADPQLVLAVNGNFLELVEDIAAGYTPPDALNDFSVGRGVINLGAGNQTLFAQHYGVAGYSFVDGVPQSPLDESALDAVRNLGAEQWNAVQEAEDVVPAAGFTDIFSVRQGLHQPNPSWPAALGGDVLQRVGAANLFTEASKPRFLRAQWEPGEIPP